MMKTRTMKSIIYGIFALSALFFTLAATAQNQDAQIYGGIFYNDATNYRNYGRFVIPRSDAANLDTLTHLVKGSLVFDTLQNRVEYVDTNGAWVGIPSGGNNLDEAYDKGGAGAGREIDAVDGAVKISGEDGLLVTGTFGSGADSEFSGSAAAMFFNPKKGAFRAGYTDVDEWDNANIGDASFAAGYATTASGLSAIALGESNFATGNNSTVFGVATTASGGISTAMGNSTTASGATSTAIGSGTVASGDYSTAMGSATTAESYSETAIGINNTDYTPTSTSAWSATDRLFVIGNGQSIGTRSDALVMLKNGNTTLNGSLSIVDGSEGDGYVLTSDASGNASWNDPSSWGEMGFADSSYALALTQNVPEWVTNDNNDIWSIASVSLRNVSYSGDSLIVGAGGDGTYFITGHLSIEGLNGSAIKAYTYKNGSVACSCVAVETLENNDIITVNIACDILPLVEGDVLTIWIENTASGAGVVLVSGKLTIHKIGQ